MIDGRRSSALIVLIYFLATGCGGSNDGGSAPGPTGTPARVNDLHATAGSATSITLTWTAPGLASGDGPVAGYDLRRALYGQQSDDFAHWSPVAGVPAPAAPGTGQSATVDGLATGATYVFRLRATVDHAQWSDLSNLVVASADSRLDLTPPAAVPDLEARWRSGNQLMVEWSTTGDDGPYGDATLYDVRYASTPLSAANWDAAAAATVQPGPVAGRLRATLDQLDAATTYYVAVRAGDDAGNVSALSDIVTSTPPGGQTWRVTADGSGDTPTIAAALTLAADGDLILVGPGRYTWTNQGGPMHDLGMIFIARNRTGITLASDAGPGATILDAEGRGRVLFIQGYNDGVIIDGFTITNGTSTPADGDSPKAGGLTYHLNNCIVRNCVFTTNSGGHGGAIYYGGRGHTIIEDCVITGNSATDFGGGVFLVNSPGDGGSAADAPVVRRCVITDNTSGGGGGGVAGLNLILHLEDCVVAGNEASERGGGVAVYGYGITGDPTAPTRIDRCSLVANSAPLGAALRVGYATDQYGTQREGQVEMSACLVAWNTGGGVCDLFAGAHLGVTCGDVFGNTADAWPPEVAIGEGNLADDPLVCDVAGGDYHLRADSPCAEGNHPGGSGCGRIGALSIGCSR